MWDQFTIPVKLKRCSPACHTDFTDAIGRVNTCRFSFETFNSTQGFIVPVNFAGLEAGEYTIELIDAAGKKVEKVTYGVKEVSKKIAHISNIDKANGKFPLSVVNTTAGEVSVKIYDAQNNLIHSETKVVTGDFAKVYKLNPAATSLTFEVSDNTGKIKTARF